MTATLIGILVSVTVLMMAGAPMLQIRKILKHQHARDISQALFWIVALGTASVALDGFYTHNYFLAIPNACSSCVNIATALLIRKHTPPEQP